MAGRPRDVYIISDLHIGGAWPTTESRGFRMMTRPDELAAFIDILANVPAMGARGVELVINGDFVDFLAEEHKGPKRWLPFIDDPSLAADTLRTIANRPEDAPIFKALRSFVGAGHRLTLLLGNHDIELSLPAVRKVLEDEILGGAATWRFLYDGEAYIVAPGVLVEHGNRYDASNEVDHDELRRLRSLQSRSQYEYIRKADFIAPAGSHLVAETMNELKEQYGFIDLLKPESEPLFALILALEPKTRKKLGDIAKLLLKAASRRMEKPALPSNPSNIAATKTPRSYGTNLVSSASSSEDAALAEVLSRGLGAQAASDLLTASKALDPGASRNPSAQNIASTRDRLVSKLGLVSLLLQGQESDIGQRLPMVQQALRALQNDQTFKKEVETAQNYKKAAAELSLDENGRLRHQFIIFGHSHLARDVKLDSGARYLNSGTWANLMHFPTALLDNDVHEAKKALEAFVADLAVNRLEPYLDFRPTYIHIAVGTAGTVEYAKLCKYDWKSGRLE